MCYASAIHFGARLRAANCVVAISNFVTFLENTQSYRRDLRRVEYGDERDRQRAELLRISPMTRVSELRIPLMVVTGANDPRVPAIGSRPDGRRGSRRRPARLASDRPERGPRLRQEGESGLSIPGPA